MRIIGGANRGLRLTPVGKGDSAAHLRPTSDRVRESLFNVLEGGKLGVSIEGAHVLDLFAGTGALGLEALSRGATHVTFVESGKTALRLLQSNIEKMRREASVRVLKQDVKRIGRNTGAPVQLVFLDPPYGKGLGDTALHAAVTGGWLADGALVVWEEQSEVVPPPGFEQREARRYGETWLTFLEFKGQVS